MKAREWEGYDLYLAEPARTAGQLSKRWGCWHSLQDGGSKSVWGFFLGPLGSDVEACLEGPATCCPCCICVDFPFWRGLSEGVDACDWVGAAPELFVLFGTDGASTPLGNGWSGWPAIKDKCPLLWRISSMAWTATLFMDSLSIFQEETRLGTYPLFPGLIIGV